MSSNLRRIVIAPVSVCLENAPPPQGLDSGDIADQSSHLWRVRVPRDLGEGTHVAEVTAVDRFGRAHTDHIVFEIRRQRPDPFWRAEFWQTVTN